MRSGWLLYLGNEITISFRPRTQLVHQYHGLNDFLSIVRFASFYENLENTCFEEFDTLRLLACKNCNLGQFEKMFDMCCMCLKLVLGP